MSKLIASIMAVVGFLGVAFSLFFWFEGRYALAEEVKQLKQTVQYEFKSQQVYKTQERAWQQQDRCDKTKDPTACREAQRLEAEKKQYEQELKELGKGKK
jgi:hypothetical protein